MAAISTSSLFFIPIAITILSFLIWGRFKERLFLVLMVLCFLLGDTGINNGLKHWTNRPRPKDALPNIRVVTLEKVEISNPSPNPLRKGHSFPSSHTCFNVELALIAWILYGGWAGLFWIWAVLMSYSRIYVGAHYPTDVIASWFIALTYTWIILKLCAWAWSKYGPDLAPRLYQQHPKLLPCRDTET